MDVFDGWGGGHPSDISQKAKWGVKKVLESISLEECMEPDHVCRNFTFKQIKRELTASGNNVYLRYFSSFLAYMHQTYKRGFPLVCTQHRTAYSQVKLTYQFPL